MKKIIYLLIIAMGLSCSPLLRGSSQMPPQEKRIGEVAQRDSLFLTNLRWWEAFEDSVLDSVINVALVNNRDLASAMANLEAARSYIAVARAEFLPSIYLTAETEAYRINGTTTKEYTLAPTLEWEISLFGELRNTRKSAVASYLATEWGYRAAVLSLTSEVATTLFTLAQYEQCYQIAQRSYELRSEATALIDSMYRYGMSSGIALEQAKSLVYSAHSEVSKYERAVEQTRQALNVLLGESTPQQIALATFSGEENCHIPTQLPFALLEHRPDVMENYFKMSGAAADVGVAHAQRFPSISLTAEAGLITETLKDLSSAKPIGWSIIGELTQPIFNFGALKRKEQIAHDKYRAALCDYEGALIDAVADVQKALIALSTYRDQTLAAEELVAANSKIAMMTSALYRSGLGDYLSVIDAQRELYTSQIDLVETMTQQYISYIDLCKALGGGASYHEL